LTTFHVRWRVKPVGARAHVRKWWSMGRSTLLGDVVRCPSKPFRTFRRLAIPQWEPTMKLKDAFARLRNADNWNAVPVRPAEVPRPRRVPQRWVVVAAAAALATLLGAGVTWVSRQKADVAAAGSAGNRAQVVPWHPIAAHQGALLLLSSEISPPDCRASQLEVSANGGGGAGGTFFVPVTVRNTATAGCKLADKQLGLHWPSGHSASIESRDRVLLGKGTQGYRLGFAGTCATEMANSHQVAMHANFSGENVQQATVQIPESVAGCSTASLVPVEPPNAEDSGTGPYSALTASLDLPPQASGESFGYTLTLTNTGKAPFSFSNCPTFTELAGIGDALTEQSYTLDCSGGGPLLPGKSRSYEMRIGVPQGTGVMKVAWIMDNGPSQTGSTTAN
jgi:hypothetical protein